MDNQMIKLAKAEDVELIKNELQNKADASLLDELVSRVEALENRLGGQNAEHTS